MTLLYSPDREQFKQLLSQVPVPLIYPSESIYVLVDPCDHLELQKDFAELYKAHSGAILLFPVTRPNIAWTRVFFPSGAELPPQYIPKDCEPIVLLSTPEDNVSSPSQPMGYGPSHFSTVALGGTFDHLHAGHRGLLTLAAYITQNLIVGVTGPGLLKNKKYADYLETYEKRQQSVSNFLSLIKPSLNLRFEMIEDVCGPTATIEHIDALVLSEESEAGGKIVNDTRRKLGFNELEIIISKLFGEGIGGKLSSTDYRRQEMENTSAGTF